VCLEGSVGNNGIKKRRQKEYVRRDVPLRVLTLLLKLPVVLTLFLNLLALPTLPKPTAVNLSIAATIL